MDFVDRILKCSDCGNDFIFTAGEQLFFVDRQFKNDPKRCKLCKAKRAGLGRATNGPPEAVATLPLSRTETRTECSACGVETTVPFKPTQGRPVFCRSCFQSRRLPPLLDPAASLNEGNQLQALPPLASSSLATMESIADSPAAARHPADVLAGREFDPMLEMPEAY